MSLMRPPLAVKGACLAATDIWRAGRATRLLPEAALARGDGGPPAPTVAIAAPLGKVLADVVIAAWMPIHLRRPAIRARPCAADAHSQLAQPAQHQAGQGRAPLHCTHAACTPHHACAHGPLRRRAFICCFRNGR